MLDLKQIRENPEQLRRAIADKRLSLDLDALLEADRSALELARKLQELQERRNGNAKSIPQANATERPDRHLRSDVELATQRRNLGGG